MERLTQKVEALGDVWLLEKGKPSELITDNDDYYNYFKKLAEYEELEEQGLLLRLPCKVGDTVYSVSFKKKCKETEENGGYLINQNMSCAFCDNENCKSKEEWFIEEITATLPMIANIILEKDKDSDDFMIYLIREEAEKNLKEMEASENAERKYRRSKTDNKND